jgi:hypothetical protein
MQKQQKLQKPPDDERMTGFMSQSGKAKAS